MGPDSGPPLRVESKLSSKKIARWPHYLGVTHSNKKFLTSVSKDWQDIFANLNESNPQDAIKSIQAHHNFHKLTNKKNLILPIVLMAIV